MKTIEGDLIKLAQSGKFDVIVHGANCVHRMGAGIAKQIKKTFPEAFNIDKTTPKGKSKLGTYSCTSVGKLIIVNAYTQVYLGSNCYEDRLQAIHNVFKLIKRDFHGMRIGIPKIGAGLAGGDWTKIQAIIAEVMKDEDITIVMYSTT